MGKRDSLGLGLVLPRGLREAEEGRSREGRSSGGESREADAEVSELTSTSEEPRTPSSHRVTPQLLESPRPPPSLTLSPPASVEELVRAVRTRVRCITLCEQEGVASPSRPLARAASCPSLSLQGAGAAPCRESRDRTKLRFTSATQTDSGLALLPYEYLFPFALPAPQAAPPPPARPDPYSALDSYIRYSV